MQNKKQELREFIVDFLQEKLPAGYCYHNSGHTLYVADKVIQIGRAENCTQEQLDLLYAAALFHDTGFVHAYVGHEEQSCLLARAYLPGFDYSPDSVNIICEMIMATKLPQSPKSPQEEIIADADLEYLGTANAAPMADLLFSERRYIDPSLTEKRWQQNQVSFLQSHQYFTRFCRENREPSKQVYLQSLL